MGVVMGFTEAAVISVGDCVGFFHVTQTRWQRLGCDLLRCSAACRTGTLKGLKYS